MTYYSIFEDLPVSRVLGKGRKVNFLSFSHTLFSHLMVCIENSLDQQLLSHSLRQPTDFRLLTSVQVGGGNAVF